MRQSCSLLRSLCILIIGTLAYAPEKKVLQEVSRAPSPHVITFFIERCDKRPICMPEKVLHSMNKAKELDRTLIEQAVLRRAVDGIYAIYMGSVATSDGNGQISFLRRHLSDQVTFIVTRSLQPILSGATTVHHFIVSPNEPVAYYLMERRSEHDQKNTSKWVVRKMETPQNRSVPLDAIVLIANPEHIVVPEESFTSTQSANLLLPTVYALPTLTRGINALYFLQFNRYFAPTMYDRRYAQTRYGTMIAP